LSGRFGSPFGDYPAMGAVVAHETGFTGMLPPYVAVPKNPSFTWELGKSAYLGGRYESFKAGDPNAKDFKVRDLSLAQPLTPASRERRKNLLQAVDTLAAQIKGNDQIATYDEFHQHAAEMILSPEAQAAFDIDKESAKLRDDYGRTEFGQSCLLRAASSSGASASSPSTTAAGIITRKFLKDWKRKSPCSTRVLPR